MSMRRDHAGSCGVLYVMVEVVKFGGERVCV